MSGEDYVPYDVHGNGIHGKCAICGKEYSTMYRDRFADRGEFQPVCPKCMEKRDTRCKKCPHWGHYAYEEDEMYSNRCIAKPEEVNQCGNGYKGTFVIKFEEMSL